MNDRALTKGSFRSCLELQAPEYLRRRTVPACFDAAADHFAAIGRLQPADVPECIRLVTHFEVFRQRLLSEPPGQQRKVFPPPPPSPAAAVTSAQLARQLRPWVESVRQALFGARHAPFTTIVDAIRWFQRELYRHFKSLPPANWPVGRWVSPSFGREEDVGDLGILLEDARDILRWALWASATAAGAAAQAGALLEGPLPELTDSAQEMAAATGFHEEDVLAYLLCDKSPRLVPVDFALTTETHLVPGGKWMSHSQARMTIHAADLSWSEWKTYYTAMRKHLHPSKGRRLTAFDAALLSLVERFGGVPVRGKAHFWERVRQALAEPEYQQRGFPAYKHWRCVRVKYLRLQKRL